MTTTARARPVWLRPTRRAIDWTPLTLVTAALLATSIIVGWRMIAVPAFIQQVGVAGLAAAAVLGLADPARPLLQALPTRPIVRLTRRVTLLAGGTALALAALVACQRVLSLTVQPALAAAVMALGATGVAVHTALSPASDHAHETAAATILLWVAAASLPIPVLPDPVRTAWLHHPWMVTAAAAAITASHASLTGWAKNH